jgi:hypothetical protein
LTGEIEPVQEGEWLRRRLPDGRLLLLVPLTFGRARLALSRDGRFYQDVW